MNAINLSLVIIILVFSAIIFSLFKYSFEYIREELRQYRLSQEKDFSKIIKAFRTPLAVIFIPLSGFLLVNNLPEPDMNDADTQVEYGIKYDNFLLKLKGYAKLIKEDTKNPEWHYRFFREIDKEGALKDLHKISPFPYRHFYDSLFNVTGYEDIAALGMGLTEFVVERNDERAMEFLGLVKDTSLAYVNYTKANILFNKSKIEEGVFYHEKEIEIGGYKEGSLFYLSDFYLNHYELEKARALLKYDPYLKYLPLDRMREEVFIPNHDVGYYLLSYIMRHVRKFSWFGFLGSLFVLGAWIFYMQKLDIFSSIPLSNQLLTVLLGMLFIFFVYPLSDLLDYYFAHYFSGGAFNLFVMSVVRIGMVEELVKIAPILLIMLFTKWFKDPYDYIFYACSSALGFAFLENLIYSAKYGTDIISTRAMISVVMHMICSSVIAYAIILAKYKKIGNVWLNVMVGFIVASLIHGFYDFWIFTRMFTIFLYFFFFIIVINWRRIINNAINNSRYFDAAKLKEFTNVEFYLVVLLLSILTVEYVLNGFEHDAEAANELFTGNLVKNGYLALYLALSIGKVDIFPGYWQKLGFPSSISALIIPKGINPLNFIGYHVRMRFSTRNVNLPYIKIAKGEIIRRLILSGEKNWFMIATDKPIVYEGNFYYHLMINFKTPEVKLSDQVGVRATIRLPLREYSQDQIEFSKKTTLWVGHCLVQKMP